MSEEASPDISRRSAEKKADVIVANKLIRNR
jgi:hypothetical protein